MTLQAEADALAQRLADITGETVSEAVTRALRERLAREEQRFGQAGELAARLTAFSGRLRDAYDTRPVAAAEWEAAGG